MKKITIIQSSLRELSNTNIVCREFEKRLKKTGLEINYIDLRELDLEFCDGRDFNKYNDDLKKTYKILEESDVIIFGMPVYQYSFSGVLKNFIDIVGGALKGKNIGVIVNAGGPNCYMASRDLLDALYFEYSTKNLSPTPYSWSMDFEKGRIQNNKVIEKLDELIENIEKIYY